MSFMRSFRRFMMRVLVEILVKRRRKIRCGIGAEEKELHRSIGKAVAASGIDALFCAGTLAEEYASEAKANPECEVHYKKTREEMTEELLAYVKEGDTVLVKASHFMEFPKVVEALTKE